MSQLTDDARTQVYEAYAFAGTIVPPKPPRSYDRELASLRFTHTLFCEGKNRFRGYVPLQYILDDSVIDQHRLLLKDKLDKTYDARVINILTHKWFWLRRPGERTATPLSVLLSNTGKWIIYVANTPSLMVITDTVDELSNVLFNQLAHFGTLSHVRGEAVDAERITWHLWAQMRQSTEIKQRELEAELERIARINASRARLKLPPLH